MLTPRSLSSKGYHTLCKLTVYCMVLVAADPMYSLKESTDFARGVFAAAPLSRWLLWVLHSSSCRLGLGAGYFDFAPPLLFLVSLNLIISLIYIIVGSPRPRPPLLACAPLHFPTKCLQNPTGTSRLQIGPFVVVAFFVVLSSKDSHDFPLKRNVFS